MDQAEVNEKTEERLSEGLLAGRKGKKILIIDDDPIVLRLAEGALSGGGYDVTVAQNGKEGLNHARNGGYDLALLDYMMPELDGLAFVSILKGAEKTKNIPVVMVTSAYDEKLRQDGFAAGVVDFFYKPFAPDELVDFVDTLFESNKLEPPESSKVLAIDDSPIVCKTYQQILSKTGHDYRIVKDSTQALETIRKFMPDLILMDAYMPNIDGYELTRMIKADKDLDTIRIIMVTADTEKKSTLKALDYGVEDFLTKPFDEEVLLARMRAHLNNKKLYDDLMKAYKEMKVLKDKLEMLSITDGLTGLYNHRHFHEVLIDELARAKRYGAKLSILLFDIDFFKKFNDTYGHKVGDRVLKTIAGVIERSKRKNDITARYGGEEFAVILPETGEEGALSIAERIRENVENTKINLSGKTLNVTISIGVAVWDHECDEHEFVDQADKALYQSKDAGRNRVTLYSC